MTILIFATTIKIGTRDRFTKAHPKGCVTTNSTYSYIVDIPFQHRFSRWTFPPSTDYFSGPSLPTQTLSRQRYAKLLLKGYCKRITIITVGVTNLCFSFLQHHSPPCLLYADLPFFSSPSLITDDSLRPDVALISPDNTLYLLELTIGLETSNRKNSSRKANTYKPLLRNLCSSYRCIHFINLSMSALGIVESSSDSVLTMIDDLGFDKISRNQISKKINNVSARCTYYIR